MTDTTKQIDRDAFERSAASVQINRFDLTLYGVPNPTRIYLSPETQGAYEIWLATRATPVSPAKPQSEHTFASLHSAIMNLPCGVPVGELARGGKVSAYQAGHRDARHAAAEEVMRQQHNLVAAAQSERESLLAALSEYRTKVAELQVAASVGAQVADDDAKFLDSFFHNLVHGDFMADNPNDLRDALRARKLMTNAHTAPIGSKEPSPAPATVDMLEEVAQIAMSHNYTGGGIEAARAIRALKASPAPAAQAADRTNLSARNHVGQGLRLSEAIAKEQIAAPAAVPEVAPESSPLAERIKIVLAGIDKDECADPEGWWETSTGAQFGAEKLAEVLALVAAEQPAAETGLLPLPTPFFKSIAEGGLLIQSGFSCDQMRAYARAHLSAAGQEQGVGLTEAQCISAFDSWAVMHGLPTYSSLRDEQTRTAGQGKDSERLDLNKFAELASAWAHMPDDDVEGVAWWNLVNFVANSASEETKRLDWLLNFSVRATGVDMGSNHQWEVFGRVIGRGATPRAAIDAAKAKGGAQ